MSLMSQMLKMIAMSGTAADRAELAALMADAAPTPVVDRKPARKGKRTLSPEQKAKMAEGRRKAAADRAGKPKPTTATPAAAAEPKKRGTAFSGNGYTFEAGETQKSKIKGHAYTPIYVNGEYAGQLRNAHVRAFVNAVRAQAGNDFVVHAEKNA